MSQKKKEIINNKLKCSKCNYWLPVEEFDNDKNTSTGKSSYCKVCRRKSHYDVKRRKQEYNSGLIGLYLFKCEQCGNDFTTKKSNKIYCSPKCRKRAWYEQNEQTKSGKQFGRSKSHLNIKKNQK
jgi:uncharacterized protein YbaR (Trm112 family)